MGTGVFQPEPVSVPCAGGVLASAPGSIMLTGEHAVLQGQKALAGAVVQRVIVRLQPRADQRVRFVSALGQCEMRLDCICTEAPFTFVGLAARDAAGGAASRGYNLAIEAEMPPHVGLGSSAAITAATYAAVHAYVHGTTLAPQRLWEACVSVIRSVQGRGSGTDAAASIYGGVILYSQDGGVEERFVEDLPPVSLLYVGYKTPTARVIDFVEGRRREDPALYTVLDQRMGQCTEAATAGIRCHDMKRLARALQMGQAVLVGYGVCDPPLQALVDTLSGQDGVQAVKISGSGLGDCVLALGRVSDPLSYAQIPVVWDTEGVQVKRV